MTDSIAIPVEASPTSTRYPDWLKSLFGTPLNSCLTIGTLALLYWTAVPFLQWALVNATWTGTPESCAARSGACWAFIGAKFRFILFGLYPPGLQARPLLSLILMFGLIGVTAIPRFWHRRLVLLWLGGLTVVVGLMSGGFDLPLVRSDLWGGFSLTMLLFLAGIGCAFPLAIMLALARRSRMGGIRLLSILVIEVVRGVPFIVVLYSATLLFPLMLPAGAAIDQLLRAETAIILFIAVFLAEAIRGGLQAIPIGQFEAATALGLSPWRAMRTVILPQALRLVIPAIVSIALNIFQDTTLVMVIGIFDFLNAARVAATDPQWLGFYSESYSFVALIYFAFCFLASRYSLWLERHINPFSTSPSGPEAD